MTAKKECLRDSDINLLQHETRTMAEHIKEIREDIKEIKASTFAMKDVFRDALAIHSKEADAKYATKEDHKMNLEKIDMLMKAVWGTVALVFAGIGTAVMNLIIK